MLVGVLKLIDHIAWADQKKNFKNGAQHMSFMLWAPFIKGECWNNDYIHNFLIA